MNGEIGGGQDEPDIVVPIADRGANNAYHPNASRGRVAGRDSPLLHNCARIDETDTDYDTLHDVCLSSGARCSSNVGRSICSTPSRSPMPITPAEGRR